MPEPLQDRLRPIAPELRHGAGAKMPPQFGTFKQAQQVKQSDPEQAQLNLYVG